jgi:hypothetical protein
MIFPGFMMPSGSSACLIARMAVADSVVRDVTAYDQPRVTRDLVAHIKSAAPVLQDTIPPEIEAQRWAA